MCEMTGALGHQAGRSRWWRDVPDPRPATAGRTPSGRTRIVLLGTGGGPNLKATRAGIATAVVVGDDVYLFDCGDGTTQQLPRAGLGISTIPGFDLGPLVRHVFLTHLHSDHTASYWNLLHLGWPAHQMRVIGPGRAGLPIPRFPPGAPELPLYGAANPTPGTVDMTDLLFAAHAYDLNERRHDENRPDLRSLLEVVDIGVPDTGYEPGFTLPPSASASDPSPPMDPIEVLPEDGNGVRVTAVLVHHPPVFPSLAFRIDTPDGSLVISGDTAPCDNLVRLAAGADVLVNEVIDLRHVEARLPRMPQTEAMLNHLAVAHTSTDQVGQIAADAGVGTLVLSHLVPGDDEIADDAWLRSCARPDGGDVVVGADLLELLL